MTETTKRRRDQPPRQREDGARSKAARDKIMAAKTIEKGLLIVHTGKGKGKSTAAFGMVLRCIGHGMRVGVVQFVKGRWETGERTVLETLPRARHHQDDGRGLHLGDPGPRARHRRRPRRLGRGQAHDGRSRAIALVLLDELNIVLRYDYLPIDEVVAVAAGQAGRTCMSSSPAATPRRS